MAECTPGMGMGPDGTADTGMAMDLDGTAATDPDGMGIDVVRTGAGSSAFRKAPIENGWRCPLLALSHNGRVMLFTHSSQAAS
jgi:hypothetical protein